jgi:hypothetical protein
MGAPINDGRELQITYNHYSQHWFKQSLVGLLAHECHAMRTNSGLQILDSRSDEQRSRNPWLAQ